MVQPDFSTPGGMIRGQREKCGLSMADLSQRTKIPEPVLAAIERDEFHKVSGALYIKSFLRTCAAELGLEAEEVLAKYSLYSGEMGSSAAGGDGVWREEEVQISRIGLPWRLIGFVALSMVVVTVGLMSVRGCRKGDAGSISEQTMVDDQTDSGEDSSTAGQASPLENNLEVEAADPETSIPLDPVPVYQPVAESVTEAESEINIKAKQEASAPEPIPVLATNMPVGVARTEFGLLLAGLAGLDFEGNEARTIVLRIVCAEPVKIQVKRDADRSFGLAHWPAVGDPALPLPAENIVAGQVYRVVEGFVVYWGARDHFSLKLGQTTGVEVTLNGAIREVGRLRQGGEMVLDVHGK